MKFAETPIEQAKGAILAHTIRLTDRVIKKGSYLGEDELEALTREGHSHVMAATLEPGDVEENTAAGAIADACTGDGITRTKAFTGRCNLAAETDGLLIVDAAALTELNLIDEAITLASLPPFSVVQKKQLVGTVKIIPYSAGQTSVDQACRLINASPVVRVVPFQSRKIGLILTMSTGMKESLLDKAAKALETRLERLDSSVAMERRCGHNTHEVAEHVEELKGAGCDLIIICGATATSDRHDVVPAGIVSAGGRIEHFGMPTDPGNLLLYGHLNDATVIGMPGCARSLKFNGFDQVLNRTMAGLTFERADFAALSVGGLLDEMANRQLPRERAVKETPEMEMPQQDTPQIAAVVLAAGRSSRMGDANKLLIDIDGKSMVRHAVDAALNSRASSVTVVTGHEADRVGQELDGLEVSLVHNPDFAEGMSTSLKCGLARLPEQVDGALVCLADMPGVESRHLDQLIEAFEPELERAICVSSFHGRRGNPVLWGRYFFPDMMALSGDIGARKLLRQFGEQVHEVDMGDDSVLLDIDTPDALERITVKPK